MKPLLPAIRKARRVLYDYSGARHVVEMARFKEPNAPGYRKPPTLFLWVVGLYVALYGIASTNYEAALDRAENRMGALASQLATTDEAAFRQLIWQIRRIQRMKTPLEPSLLWPFRGSFAPVSLFVEAPNPAILEWTKEIMKAWKGRLAGMELVGVDLSGAELKGADLSGAGLFGADLSWARLRGADLSEAKLWEADLSRADLEEANLSGAQLKEADLSGAWFYGADLAGARLLAIKNWQAIKFIKKTNILGVRDAPEGFREWALKNGAVEMEPAAWKAFREK